MVNVMPRCDEVSVGRWSVRIAIRHSRPGPQAAPLGSPEEASEPDPLALTVTTPPGRKITSEQLV